MRQVKFLYVVWLLLSASFTQGGPNSCRLQASIPKNFTAALPFVSEPFSTVQGVVLYSGCLTKKDDRFLVVPSKSAQSIRRDDGGAVESLYLLASDLCAMGHTTKDPAHFASFLLDYFSEVYPRQIRLVLVYGNVCMVRNMHGGNKRSAVFLNVLRGWFHAVLRVDSPVIRELRKRGVQFVEQTSIATDHDASIRITLAAKEIYMQDIAGSSYCDNKEHVTIVKRHEKWRWFRNSVHANLFRGALLFHYNVMDVNEPTSLRRAPLNVAILRRDEDRHFDEINVFKHLQNFLSPLAAVSIVTFDNIRGPKGRPPPPHKVQLEILHNTSILIAAHGAGLAAVAAMVPGSAVIELFPHNFRYYMYEELCGLLGIKYIAFESPVVWPPRCCSARGGDSMPVVKEGKPSLVNGVGARACKKCDIKISSLELETLVRTALVHVLGGSMMQFDSG